VARAPRPRGFVQGSLLRNLHWFDHHKSAHRPFIHELDAAGDLGEQSVVFAAANIQPWLYPRTALPHDDGSTVNDLTAESLESQPLRIRIAAVP
jgi:hypothetical protein